MKDVNISTATKNNWERLGKGDIETDAEIISRLSKRANKQYSVKNIIPIEYFLNPKNYIILEKILKYTQDYNVDIKTLIFNLALNYLSKSDLIVLSETFHWSANNFYLEKILQDFDIHIYDEYLLNMDFPADEVDFLGIVYQSLLLEGNKNKQGSYYTPGKIVKSLCENLSKESVFLDPCCGTGSFLLNGASEICSPENIFGCDIDEVACFIAKINLIVKFKTVEFNPNIYNIDFLSDNKVLNEKIFDVIATNPPWGAQISKKVQCLFPEIKSGESYSLFITKAIRLMKQSGTCCFVLPESILNIKTHSDIRKYILENSSISEIRLLGKVFSGVLSGVVLLKLEKSNREDVLISTFENSYNILQQNFKTNKHYNFAIYSQQDSALLAKIYSVKHLTLENSKWALGIVTGNNNKHITPLKADTEVIYTGKDVLKYCLRPSQRYIHFNPENFQQCAQTKMYRAPEKLVYKFISKKLVFAYDNTGALVLNSANILIPNIETHSIKTVLAFLNSSVFQYIYNKKFSVLKVLKSNLVQMPFPLLSEEFRISIEALVDLYLSEQDNKYLNDIDLIIYKLFNLNVAEIEYLENEL